MRIVLVLARYMGHSFVQELTTLLFSKVRWYTLLIVVCYYFTPTQLVAQEASLDFRSVDFEDQKLYSLDGKWEFYWQQLYEPKDFQEKQLDPLYIDLPRVWNGYELPNGEILTGEGYATFRIKLLTSPDLPLMGIEIPAYYNSYALWINGKKISTNGTVGTSKETAEPKWIPLLKAFPAAAEVQEIIIQVSSFRHQKGGIYLTPKIGVYDTLHRKRELFIAETLFLSGCLLVCSFLFLGLFIFKKSYKAVLYFSLFCLAFAYRFLASDDGDYFLIYLFPKIPWEISTRLEYLALYWGTAWGALFIYYTFKEYAHLKVAQAMLAIVWVYTITTLFPVSFFSSWILSYNIIQLIYLTYVFYIFIYVLIKSEEKILPAFSVLSLSFMTLSGVYALLVYIGVATKIPLLLSASFLLFVLSQAFILASKFAMAFHKVEELKNDVEQYFTNIQHISKIGQELTSNLDFSAMLSYAYDRINAIMDAEEFGVGIYDAEQKLLHHDFYIMNGKRIEDELVTNIEEAERFSSFVVRNKKGIILHDVKTEYQAYIPNLQDFDENDLLASVICLPLIVEDKVLGIISVQSSQQNAYSNYHYDILQTMANYLAIALDNANAYDSLKKTNALLYEKNNNILDSIRYGKTIQTAFLPDLVNIQQHFSETALLYLPKDVVSGDFYWYFKTKEAIYLAVADCTGHGVPGAFMSIIGISLLNDIVSNQHDVAPEQILINFDQLLRESLNQNRNQNLDGIDIALCKIETDSPDCYNIQFSGAKRPLYYLKNQQLTKIKGERRSVGGFHKAGGKRHYISHELTLQKGDCLYMLSDGLCDQNDEERKKFGSHRLEAILQAHQASSMDEQIGAIHQQLTAFKGNSPQRDDIALLGIRL